MHLSRASWNSTATWPHIYEKTTWRKSYFDLGCYLLIKTLKARIPLCSPMERVWPVDGVEIQTLSTFQPNFKMNHMLFYQPPLSAGCNHLLTFCKKNICEVGHWTDPVHPKGHGSCARFHFHIFIDCSFYWHIIHLKEKDTPDIETDIQAILSPPYQQANNVIR